MRFSWFTNKMVVVADEGVPDLGAWQFPQERANALPTQTENGVAALSAVSVIVENEPEGILLPRVSYDEIIQEQQVVGEHRNPVAMTASELTTDESLTERHVDVADSSDDEPNSDRVSGIHTVGYRNQL